MIRTTVFALAALTALSVTGCNRERPDSTVNAAVLAKLDQEPALTAVTVQSRTEQGHVYLTGRVATPEQRRRAEDLADDVKGVKEVTNDIQVDVSAPPPSGSMNPPTQAPPPPSSDSAPTPDTNPQEAPPQPMTPTPEQPEDSR